MSGHPYRLVAPWYRWPRYAGDRRDSPPVLQKYETSQLVDLFRGNPQRSLKFTPEDVAEGRRKLFQPAHRRFYLVVCELHCDRPGFPDARGDDVCEAGFVIRRRRVPVPQELEQEAGRILERIGRRRANLAALGARLEGASRRTSAVAVAHAGKLQKAHEHAQSRLDDLHAQLREFAETNELRERVEGWVPSELESVGSWSHLDGQTPEAGDEAVFRLFRLQGDAQGPAAARGRSLYFGLVPTGSGDAQADGAPRFEPGRPYELRCFVRRHDPRCPRRPGRRDCCGELVWSEPSESFAFAAHSDLVGTSNRPLTIAMPDANALAAQAAALPFGAGAPLKFASPAGALAVAPDADGKPVELAPPPFPQICSFAIPLITIVAQFVLKLFLPVVVLLFGLWLLLRLRFCILPSVDLGLDLTAELDLLAGGVDLEAGAGIDVDARRAQIAAALDARLEGAQYPGAAPGARMAAEYALGPLVQLTAEQQLGPLDARVAALQPDAPATEDAGPNSALAPLVWEAEVAVPEVRAG